VGHSVDIASTIGRVTVGSHRMLEGEHIGREERTADRDADTPQLDERRVTAPVERYLANAFGDRLVEVRRP
jgi:hypothetical protein